ncbi:MAG: hypothetical protein ACRDD1_05215, partial [Planctomycetia bacterium]
MKVLVPSQFYFRFALRCRKRESFVGGKAAAQGHIVDLPTTHKLPFPGEMDNLREFAEFRMAWNATGLALQWRI